MIKTQYTSITPYITKDGSRIRELMHPDVHGNRSVSLAEATIDVGRKTVRHQHIRSEEIYHITRGEGIMTLDDSRIPVQPGDTVCIPPGTSHQIENTGAVDLKVLCCCSPAYAHEDTVLIP